MTAHTTVAVTQREPELARQTVALTGATYDIGGGQQLVSRG